MPVILQNTSNSGHVSATFVEVSHVVSTGTSLLIAVGCIQRFDAARNVTGVFFDGVPLTKFTNQEAAYGDSSIWYMNNPPIKTATLRAEFNGTGTTVVGGLSFSNALPPIGAKKTTYSSLTTWTLTPDYNALGYYVAGVSCTQQATGWWGSTAEISGSTVFCHGFITNYARQVIGYYKVGSDQDAWVWQTPRVRWGAAVLCTIPPRPAGGRMVIVMSKIQEFYRDLKRGLIPPDLLQKRYGELLLNGI